jgi:hypothetical protein
MPYETAMGAVAAPRACSAPLCRFGWHSQPGLSMCTGEPIAASSYYRGLKTVLHPESGEPNRPAPHFDDQWLRATTDPPFAL